MNAIEMKMPAPAPAPAPAAASCGGECQCAGAPAEVQAEAAVASINGIPLHAPGQRPDPDSLRELAYTELLRQEAVNSGLLAANAHANAAGLDEVARLAIEEMVDRAVITPEPGEAECRRYYDANQAQFVVGRALHLRHILFAVTPGVNVSALTRHADQALLELLHKDVPAGRFAELAAQLSNCPSSTQAGDLGWIGPDDCAPELAKELFHQNGLQAEGVLKRLVHTRFGFHIIDVLERREGRQASFEEVRDRVAAHLTLNSRSRALHQYMRLLVGQAVVEGVELDGADSPLVQ